MPSRALMPVDRLFSTAGDYVSRLLGVCVALSVVTTGAAAAAVTGDGSMPAPASVARLATHVPTKVLDTVGAGHVLGQSSFPVSKLHGPVLKSAGKPELLTTILAWCPHCAASSWSLAVALSRFGTLSGLRIIDTGTLYPQFHHTHGLSFLHAHFNSRYLNFVPVVLQDVNGRALQSETPRQQKAIASFDSTGSPAIDIAGRWGFIGSGYSPGVLTGKSWAEIAKRLAKPNTAVAKSADGLANLLSAAICKITAGQPASVCNSLGVIAAGHRLR
jgi:hypothetical protein